jgi:hypothetical protein
VISVVVPACNEAAGFDLFHQRLAAALMAQWRAGYDMVNARRRSRAGCPSLMMVVLFLGGVQLMFLGIIGEYFGRVFNGKKPPPRYLVQHYVRSPVWVGR